MNLWLLVVLAYFVLLMLLFLVLNERRAAPVLRRIPALQRMRRKVESAVEDGSSIHVALGSQEITSPQAAAAMLGLSLLKRVNQITASGDHPPIASTGSGTLVLLAQDTIRSAYRTLGQSSGYSNILAQAIGLSPYAYAAGAMSLASSENTSLNLLVGSFGAESIFITSASHQVLSIAGSGRLTGQAVMYADAEEPLIGEELYAAGAYMDAGPMHTASLQTQDVVRWALVILISGSAIWGLVSELIL